MGAHKAQCCCKIIPVLYREARILKIKQLDEESFGKTIRDETMIIYIESQLKANIHMNDICSNFNLMTSTKGFLANATRVYRPKILF